MDTRLTVEQQRRIPHSRMFERQLFKNRAAFVLSLLLTAVVSSFLTRVAFTPSVTLNGRDYFAAEKSTLSPSVLDAHSATNFVADFGTYSRIQREGRSQFAGRTRAHSLPFITGDGFRMLADVVIDEVSSGIFDEDGCFDWRSPSTCSHIGRSLGLTSGQAVIIFVKSDQVTSFFSSGCFEAIDAAPIVLVTHNGDDDMPSDVNARYLDFPQLVHWFAQNCDREHAKLTCIPIGLENRHWGPPSNAGAHGSLPELMLGMMSARAPAYPVPELAQWAVEKMNESVIEHTWAFFSAGTHPSRARLLSLLANAHAAGAALWATTKAPTSGRYFVSDLYREMLYYAAIVCPRGNGRDTHRMWEALYLGRLVVTLHSPADALWDGLPVLLLDSWDALPGAEDAVLAAARNARIPPAALQKLTLPYWMCLIGAAARRRDQFCSMEAILRILHSPGYCNS